MIFSNEKIARGKGKMSSDLFSDSAQKKGNNLMDHRDSTQFVFKFKRKFFVII